VACGIDYNMEKLNQWLVVSTRNFTIKTVSPSVISQTLQSQQSFYSLKLSISPLTLYGSINHQLCYNDPTLIRTSNSHKRQKAFPQFIFSIVIATETDEN
jgi:hypothetical protein